MAQVVEILQHVYTCQHHNDLVTHVAVLGKMFKICLVTMAMITAYKLFVGNLWNSTFIYSAPGISHLSFSPFYTFFYYERFPFSGVCISFLQLRWLLIAGFTKINCYN